MRLRARMLLVGLAAASALGCADLKALIALSSDLQSQYHMQANVHVSNDRHLTITFPSADLEAMKLDSAGRAGFAHDVASFTKSHYQKAAELEDISIAFQSKSSVLGAEVTVTEAPYHFRVSELP